jgi:hypothetical protein
MSLFGAYAIFMEIVSCVDSNTRRKSWLTLIVKRNCGSYANRKRQKRGEDVASLSHMKPDCRTFTKEILPGFFNGILQTGEIPGKWYLTKVVPRVEAPHHLAFIER